MDYWNVFMKFVGMFWFI